MGENAVHPSEICVIGDRLLTDIMFGNRYGMRTVLVRPISLRQDHPLAVVIRFVELHFILPVAKAILFVSQRLRS